MHRTRGSREPPAGPTSSGSRTNRLRRSYRPGQQSQGGPGGGSPHSQKSDFRTPTRIHRPGPGGVSTEESPHNDSDVQQDQDIIWDATSPSPSRHCKRGKKTSAGVVNISEIVSRIAPKHGRPQASEPVLQQWIGDSAAIPCTPYAPEPTHRKKSPRLNGVDDLLKLAKQFDFNMFHQDKEEEEEQEEQEEEEEVQQPQSPGLLSDEDLFTLDVSPSRRHGDAPPEPGAGPQDQLMEDDLDFLFDRSTQDVGGNLSQASPSSQNAVVAAATAPVSMTTSKAAPAKDEFEDDWENDDLLNDSLVMEMTQNPLKFTAPQLCSTQRPGPGPGGGPRPKGNPVRAPLIGRDQPAVYKVEKEAGRLRSTFRLESSPHSGFRRTNGDMWSSTEAHPTRWSPSPGVPVQQNRLQPKPVNPEPQKAQIRPGTGATPAPTSQRSPQKPEKVPDEDLNRFFSDPVWDDPADDDLLCEFCEDLENQIQTAVASRLSVPAAQRAVLQPDHTTGVYRDQADPQRPAGPPSAGPGCDITAPVSLRSTQTRNTTTIPRDQFTFKRPNNPVSMATGRGSGPCSAAEIQRKKQEAMERRRQRQQAAAHNLRAPT